jgi:MscS family membrane protein
MTANFDIAAVLQLGSPDAAVEYAKLSWGHWLAALVVVFTVLLFRRLLTWYINGRVLAASRYTVGDVDARLISELHRSANWLLMFIAIWLAILIVPLPQAEILTLGQTTFTLGEVLQYVSVTLIIFFIAKFLNSIFETVVYFAKRRASASEAKTDQIILPFIRDVVKVVLWIFTTLVIVQVWGFNVTTLLAGLGIGGLAVAFAAQETISNVFGGVTVLMDKPFGVGDWIKIDAVEGIVEEVGMRSTRIRTFYKSQITLPNSKITSSVIENYTRMPMRRVRMHVGLAYWSTPQQVNEFILGARDLLVSHGGVDPETTAVFFESFGASDLAVLVQYFTPTVVWKEHQAIKQDINLKLMLLAKQVGLDFAYPAAIEFQATLEKEVPHPWLKLDYSTDGNGEPLA